MQLQFEGVHGAPFKSTFIQEELFAEAKQAIKRSTNPCKITFENINYSVEISHKKNETLNQVTPTNTLHIIKDVSGYALPG